MKTWKIPVTKQIYVYGLVEIEADNLEEAVKIVSEDKSNPPTVITQEETECLWYVTDDTETIRECYNNNQQDTTKENNNVKKFKA